MNLFFFAISLILYFALHSFLADNKIKNYLIQNFVRAKYYRLAYNLVAMLSLFGIFFFYIKLPHQFLFENSTIHLFGMVLGCVGLILVVIALLQYNLGEFTGIQQLRDQSSPTIVQLKTTGFNSIVRHPLYFATLCLSEGFFLYQPTDKNLVVLIIITLYLYFGTKLEEQKLIQEFGEAYRIYQKKVKMLIPFIF